MSDKTWGEKFPVIQDDGDLKVHLSGASGDVPVTTYPIDNQPWLIDGDSKAIVTIPWEHHLVHEGYLWSALDISTGVADNAKHLYHFKTGAGKRVHLSIELYASTKAYATVYSGATMSDNGAQVTAAANKIGDTSHEPDLKIYDAPTVAVNGTVMGSMLLGAGSKQSPSGGGSRAGGAEWELEQNTSYWVLLEAKGGAGVTTDFEVEATFYKEPS